MKKGIPLVGALAIVAFAGMANGSSHTTQVVVVGFDKPSEILTGVNAAGVGYFKRSLKTQYRLAKLKPTAPPNPCNVLARVWNRVMPRVPAHRKEKVGAWFFKKFAQNNCPAVVEGAEQTFPIDLESYEPSQVP